MDRRGRDTLGTNPCRTGASLQMQVSQILDENQRRVAAKNPFTIQEKEKLEDIVAGFEVCNKEGLEVWERTHRAVTRDEGGENEPYERERELTRKTYQAIQDDINSIYNILETAPVDEDATEACDTVSVLTDDILMLATDLRVIALIKDNVHTPPHSFESTHWPDEVKALPILPMTWPQLYQIQWKTLQPDLEMYMLNELHRPRRQDYTKPPAERVGLTWPQMKTFEKIRDYVRIDGGTGIMYLVANHQPDGSGARYCSRRILTDVTKMKEIFVKYWHRNDVGSHRRAATLHRRLQTMFLGLPRETIKKLITSTDLDQVQRDTGTFRKVTHPLVSSKPMEHVQLDLFIVNRTQNYANLVCTCTKFCFCEPLKDKSAESIIEFCDQAFSMFSYPTILQTDNGSEFNNASFKQWNITNNILWRSSRAYKPTTQGAVERLNRTLKSAIYQDWVLTQTMTPRQFRDVVNCYNRTVHSTTGYTPYELMFGRKEAFTPMGVRVGEDRLMEWIQTNNLVSTFQHENPTIPNEWIRQNARLIAADEIDLLHYYGVQTSTKIVVKPPLRLLEDGPSTVHIGPKVYTELDDSEENPLWEKKGTKKRRKVSQAEREEMNLGGPPSVGALNAPRTTRTGSVF